MWIFQVAFQNAPKTWEEKSFYSFYTLIFFLFKHILYKTYVPFKVKNKNNKKKLRFTLKGQSLLAG